MLRAIGQLVARIPFVRRALEDKADLSAFRARPSARLVIGVTLITLSFFLAWPVIAILGYVAVDRADPLVIFIGGPLMYGVSWGTWGLGMVIAGKDAIKYPTIFLRWLTRVCVSFLLGPAAATSEDTHGASQ